MNSDVQNLCKEEYFHLQKTVEDFDSRTLIIKAWSVTASMAGLAASFIKGGEGNIRAVSLLAAMASICFWLVEGLWKNFQQSYYKRIYEIEESFRNFNSALLPLQISVVWTEDFEANNPSRYLKVLTYPHVFLPHLPVALLGIGLWLFRI